MKKKNKDKLETLNELLGMINTFLENNEDIAEDIKSKTFDDMLEECNIEISVKNGKPLFFKADGSVPAIMAVLSCTVSTVIEEMKKKSEPFRDKNGNPMDKLIKIFISQLEDILDGDDEDED